MEPPVDPSEVDEWGKGKTSHPRWAPGGLMGGGFPQHLAQHKGEFQAGGLLGKGKEHVKGKDQKGGFQDKSGFHGGKRQGQR